MVLRDGNEPVRSHRGWLAGLFPQKHGALRDLDGQQGQEVSAYDAELPVCGLQRQVIAFQFENAMIKAGKRKVDAFQRVGRGCEHARRERTPCRAEIQKENGRKHRRPTARYREKNRSERYEERNRSASAQSFAIPISNAVGCNKRNGRQDGERKKNLPDDTHVSKRNVS